MNTSHLAKLSISKETRGTTYPRSDVSEGKELISIDEETIPDEEFFNQNNNPEIKKRSWPNEKGNISFKEGPNINIKLPRRSYSSKEEKCYFYNKIKIKQKTEVELF